MKHLNITIHGQVQGIFFRRWLFDAASDLGLNGFAENRPDGSVYTEVEGEPGQLEQFLGFCRIGPAGAVVANIQIDEAEVKHFNKFEKK